MCPELVPRRKQQQRGQSGSNNRGSGSPSWLSYGSGQAAGCLTGKAAAFEQFKSRLAGQNGEGWKEGERDSWQEMGRDLRLKD